MSAGMLPVTLWVVPPGRENGPAGVPPPAPSGAANPGSRRNALKTERRRIDLVGGTRPGVGAAIQDKGKD